MKPMRNGENNIFKAYPQFQIVSGIYGKAEDCNVIDCIQHSSYY